jgi:glycosyltransferase involved in cell wall biosynthesis
MKIMHIIPSLHGGGAEKFCIDLSNQLANEDEVVICSLYDITSNMFMPKAINKKIKVITLHKKLGFDISIFFKLYQLIKKENPDIINTHLRALSYTFFSLLLSKKSYFHTVHNMADKETDKVSRVLYKFFYKFLGVTPISISKTVLKSVQKEYGTTHDIMIDNGVKFLNTSNKLPSVIDEINNLKKDKNTKVLLNIGRISKQKNQILLINVVNTLVKEGHNLILLIIGKDTSPEQTLLNTLKSTAKKNIYFLGAKENIIDYLSISDAFCLSSTYEGLPITLLEALSTATIPICTPAGGIIDIISDDIGFLSSDCREKAYYNSIKMYLETPEEKLRLLQKNAKNLFHQKYDIKITAKKYKNIYSDFIEKNYMKNKTLEIFDNNFYWYHHSNKLFKNKHLIQFSETTPYNTINNKYVRSYPFSLLNRLLRTGIHNIIPIENGYIVVVKNNFLIYRDNKLIKVFPIPRGSRPLRNAICVKDDYLFFGDYWGNKNRKKANVYKLNLKDFTLTIILSLQARHIHFVVLDQEPDQLIIGTGDSNQESMMLFFNYITKEQKLIGTNSQQYRAVSIIQYNNFLIWGTDAPDEQNYIYSYNKNNGKTEQLSKIEGPAYYSTKTKDNILYIATTIEDKSKHKAILYQSKNILEWEGIKEFKKDIFNEKYFGYGLVEFIHGQNKLQKLYYNLVNLHEKK